MRTFLLSIIAFIATIPAYAATCDPGEWLNGTTCTKCDNPYYCPGDDMRYECQPLVSYDPDVPIYYSEPGATECKPCPLYDGDRTYFEYYGNSLVSPLACRVGWHPISVHEDFIISCNWSPGVGDYMTSDPGDKQKCMIDPKKCAAGYYVDMSNTIITHGDIKRFFTSAYPTSICVPVPVGYYSPTDDLYSHACPDGTSTHTDTAASADACVPLCANGGKKLHAGEHEFNIWPDGTCTSPSIGIGLPNGTCCVNLAPGAGTGITVEWNGKIYHTIN